MGNEEHSVTVSLQIVGLGGESESPLTDTVSDTLEFSRVLADPQRVAGASAATSVATDNLIRI